MNYTQQSKITKITSKPIFIKHTKASAINQWGQIHLIEKKENKYYRKENN